MCGEQKSVDEILCESVEEEGSEGHEDQAAVSELGSHSHKNASADSVLQLRRPGARLVRVGCRIFDLSQIVFRV